MANEPQPADVIIGEETLSGLPLLRHLIMTMYLEWANDQDPTVVQFVGALNELFRDPLINFDTAYALFNSACATKEGANVVGDHWRVFQMMVYTELDADREKVFTDFISMVCRIMGDSPGGDALHLRKLIDANVAPAHGPKAVMANMSYVILLAVRVYIGGVRGINAPAAKT